VETFQVKDRSLAGHQEITSGPASDIKGLILPGKQGPSPIGPRERKKSAKVRKSPSVQVRKNNRVFNVLNSMATYQFDLDHLDYFQDRFLGPLRTFSGK